MREPSARWTRHFFYRSERVRTTWRFRLALLALIVIATWLTARWWTDAIGSALVCDPSREPSDAILVENFDPDYLLFEQAASLVQSGVAARVLVPVPVDQGTQEPNLIAAGTVQVMARVARIGTYELIPVHEVEPISLNAAWDVRRFLEREHIRSVLVVTPLFRSRRSALVYRATVGRAGISVRCQPVGGLSGTRTWIHSWHGVQNVVEQWLKLQYYRLYVLPFRSSGPPHDARLLEFLVHRGQHG